MSECVLCQQPLWASRERFSSSRVYRPWLSLRVMEWSQWKSSQLDITTSFHYTTHLNLIFKLMLYAYTKLIKSLEFQVLAFFVKYAAKWRLR
jgi:hypothetical protein